MFGVLVHNESTPDESGALSMGSFRRCGGEGQGGGVDSFSFDEPR